MRYEHTQHGRWHLIPIAVVGGMLVGAWIAREELAVAALLLGTVTVFVLCSLMFGSLTIRDDGKWLSLRFAPQVFIPWTTQSGGPAGEGDGLLTLLEQSNLS
jgi:hypothetical protein